MPPGWMRVLSAFRWMSALKPAGTRRTKADPAESDAAPYNMWTRAAPFDSLRIADIGDMLINTFDLRMPCAA